MPDVDATIQELAGRQRGVVTRRQLLDAGVPAHAVDYRVRRGRMHPIHRGVYRIGAADLAVPGAPETAALLACGDDAVLCGPSAGSWWKVLPRPGRTAPVSVGLRRGDRRSRPGIRTFSLHSLRPDEVTRHRGLPVTTPGRTILDLSRSLRHRALEQAVAKADRNRLAGTEDLLRLLERHAGRPGTRRLRELLRQPGGPGFTRSEAEDRFYALIRKAKMPLPRRNVKVHGVEVDYFWPQHRFVAEMDGYSYHSSRTSFEWDHDRDAKLQAAGLTVHRVTWEQVETRPEVVLTRLAQALAVHGTGGAW